MAGVAKTKAQGEGVGGKFKLSKRGEGADRTSRAEVLVKRLAERFGVS